MTYDLRCTVCAYTETAADVATALELEARHLAEAGVDHAVDIVLRD
ncbi:hypothetical protein [Haloferax larsenii]|uniref:Uncharacterized protein n=1 Tax=Haloferax larsenii TaxID=302484 RepID=A0ABY5RLW8_HALLR|nr:hypothetical protein [Haloferax larsenii]UVE52388.1 hypothetical protein KU306_17385 [Haloferax larsenii]